MNPDVTDVAILFAFCICVIVISLASAIHTAYRAGYWAGKRHGVLWEKRRRRRVEERVEEKINQTFESASWERELDV